MQGSSFSTTLVSGLPVPRFVASAFKLAGVTVAATLTSSIFFGEPVPTFVSLVVTAPAALGSVTTVVSTVFPVTALVVFVTSVTGLAWSTFGSGT